MKMLVRWMTKRVTDCFKMALNIHIIYLLVFGKVILSYFQDISVRYFRYSMVYDEKPINQQISGLSLCIIYNSYSYCQNR